MASDYRTTGSGRWAGSWRYSFPITSYSLKESVVVNFEYRTKRRQFTDSEIVRPCFDLRIDTPRHVAAGQLKLGDNLLLCHSILQPHIPYVLPDLDILFEPHASIPPPEVCDTVLQ